MVEMPEMKGIEANLWKIYFFKFLHGFFLSIPIIVVFWQQNGLSMFQVMLLQSLFAIAVISLEVPSGYFADNYGRRKTMMYASFFATLGIIAYSLGHGFLHFLFGELLWAVAVSLISGADSAMFYDTLVEIDAAGRYQELWGKATSYYMFSAATAAILGGLIAEYNLRWTLFIQIPIFAAMIPVAYTMKEPEHHRNLAGRERKTIKAIMSKVWNKKQLRWLILYGAFIYAALQVAFWMYQPYFELSGLDIATFGVIFASFNVVSAVSSKYAHAVEARLGKRLSLGMLSVLVVASLFLMSSFVAALSVTFILLQQLVRGFSKPVISDYVNELVASDERSTILSTRSFLGRLMQGASLPVFGLIIDLYSLPQALTVLGTTVFAGGIILLLLLSSENAM